jgi:hypothetical protein
MIIELKCVEQGHTDKRWHLDIKGEAAVLATVSGEEVARFPQADALKRFKMPGLLENERHFAIAFDEQTVRFALDIGALNKIENFLYKPVAAAPAPAPLPKIGNIAPIIAGRPTSVPMKSSTRVTTPVKVLFALIGLAIFGAQICLTFMEFQRDVPRSAYFLGGIVGRLTCALVGVLITVMCVQSIRRNSRANDLVDSV